VISSGIYLCEPSGPCQTAYFFQDNVVVFQSYHCHLRARGKRKAPPPETPGRLGFSWRATKRGREGAESGLLGLLPVAHRIGLTREGGREFFFGLVVFFVLQSGS
jgi:hypothetical protein